MKFLYNERLFDLHRCLFLVGGFVHLALRSLLPPDMHRQVESDAADRRSLLPDLPRQIPTGTASRRPQEDLHARDAAGQDRIVGQRQ